MHFCDICDYQTSQSNNIKKHYNTKKHINNTIANSIIKSNIELICVNCKKEYKFLNGLKKHQLKCNQIENSSLLNDKINEVKKDFRYKLEIEKLKLELELKTEQLKTEYEQKLEIERLKSEYELKLKNQECETLKITNNNSNNNNKITNNITNINIDNTSDFIVENIIQYQNLSSLILNNIEIKNFEIINQLFDDLNLYKINSLDCNFHINKTKIQIKLVDGKFTLYLPDINSTTIKPLHKT